MITVLTLASCGRPPAHSTATMADPSGYASPPTVSKAVRLADGGVALSGQAPAGAEVRLRDPSSALFNADAGDDGVWTLGLPPSRDPRMFAFEADASGRIVRGEGALLALPSPDAPALLVRAGYGALPIDDGGGALRLTAIDYDGGGGGSASGLTAPKAMVNLNLDGQPVGEGQADAQGRFAILDLASGKPFSPGQHIVSVQSRGQAVQASFTVVLAPLGDQPFRAAREGPGWRIDWAIPGGGVQTTLVLDAPGRPAS